jgi:hypothetical protein
MQEIPFDDLDEYGRLLSFLKANVPKESRPEYVRNSTVVDVTDVRAFGNQAGDLEYTAKVVVAVSYVEVVKTMTVKVRRTSTFAIVDVSPFTEPVVSFHDPPTSETFLVL